ncbi:MAG: 3-mercaptopyruvate sulfurtransferase [Gemmatimonadales bacterium]|nr:3-mercaptopyruvate sulfurtransferase [Gemmatimonadales bacterium]
MTTTSLPTPLVSTDWLARHLGEAELVVVDASWYLPAANRDPRGEHVAGHIPGALFWDIDVLSDRASPLPHMLPNLPALARSIGALGIGDRDRVVVYDGSGVNLSAPRVWWTLHLLGHEAVAVLDGGLAKWKAEGRKLESGWADWKPRGFHPRARPELLRTQAQVESAVATGAAQLLDARSRGRFEGTEPEPRLGLRGGHIPTAHNLPFGTLVGADGTMLSKDQLLLRYAEAGVDLGSPVIVSCGSGVTACALALGLHLLGHRAYAVYDGSWSEWGREAGPPVERGPAPP